jgi:hypothetical protein
VLDYLAKQKIHHARKTTVERLERTAFDDDGSPLPGPVSAAGQPPEPA